MNKNIKNNPIHLGKGAKTYVEPSFSGMEWCAEYAVRRQDDGVEGRLIQCYEFQNSWESWEMHPEGEELVLCLEGEIEVIQEIEGEEVSTILSKDEYVINGKGVWHTADVNTFSKVLFITPGLGTAHRSR